LGKVIHGLKREAALPLNLVSAAVGKECGGKFDNVTRVEHLSAEEFRGKFHGGDIAVISVYPGKVRHANGRLIENRLQPCANATANRFAASADGNSPFRAIRRGHDFVPIKDILDDILGIEPKVDRPLIPADV
jgi:hypothetical protein